VDEYSHERSGMGVVGRAHPLEEGGAAPLRPVRLLQHRVQGEGVGLRIVAGRSGKRGGKCVYANEAKNDPTARVCEGMEITMNLRVARASARLRPQRSIVVESVARRCALCFPKLKGRLG